MARTRWGHIALATIVITIAVPAIASADVVQGVVEDALLHPLQGATVVVHDASGTEIAKAATDKDGRFSLTVPLGDYTVEASSPGLVSDHQHVQLQGSPVPDIELVLVNSEEIVEIHEEWSVPEPSKATGSIATVNRQQLTELPGSENKPVTEVVATRPGVVQDAVGNIYVRGNHGDVQYQIDGIPIPDAVGSTFAASIPVRLIESLEMQTGGMAAEYGNRLGAVINLMTKSAGEHPEGNVSMRYGSYNTLQPGAVYATKLSDRTGMFIGGNFNYSQRALEAPSIEPLHDAGYSGSVFGRLDYQPCDVNRYEVIAMYANNHYQIPIDPSVAPYDPANPVRPPDKYGNESPPFVPHDTNATETENEAFAAMSWIHKLDHGQIQMAPIYKLSRGKLLGDPEHALGAMADPGSTTSDVTRTAQHFGGIASLTWTTGSHTLKTGIQTDFLHGITRFTAYQREDMFGGIGMEQSGSDHTNALLSGAYVQDHVKSGDLVLDFGVRADELHVILEGGKTNDSIGVSPRLGTSYTVAKNYVAHAFAGVKWMPPSPTDASSAARALGVVPAGEQVAYDLKPETDLFSEAGVEARPAKTFSTDLTVWGRYAYNQLDDTLIGSTSLESNYNFKRGRAAGLEMSAELRVGPWMSMFANGSLGFAQGQGISSSKFLFSPEELADNSWQTLDHAQTFTGNAGATLRQERFSVTGLAAYASGLRTGATNQDHVPGHLRADVSMQYQFVTHEYPLRVGVDVINVADAHYAYRLANGVTGSSYGAPRTVFLSLSVPLASEPHHGGE